MDGIGGGRFQVGQAACIAFRVECVVTGFFRVAVRVDHGEFRRFSLPAQVDAGLGAACRTQVGRSRACQVEPDDGDAVQEDGVVGHERFIALEEQGQVVELVYFEIESKALHAVRQFGAGNGADDMAAVEAIGGRSQDKHGIGLAERCGIVEFPSVAEIESFEPEREFCRPGLVPGTERGQDQPVVVGHGGSVYAESRIVVLVSSGLPSVSHRIAQAGGSRIGQDPALRQESFRQGFHSGKRFFERNALQGGELDFGNQGRVARTADGLNPCRVGGIGRQAGQRVSFFRNQRVGYPCGIAFRQGLDEEIGKRPVGVAP